MLILRQMKWSTWIALLIPFVVAWVRTYHVSDWLSCESTGQKTFGHVSTGVATGRGQLLLFRNAIGPPDPDAAPRSRFRHIANPRMHFDLQNDSRLTKSVNIAGFGIFQGKPQTPPGYRHSGTFIPNE